MAAYKIKDLERISGIKAHTIRIWEKRYGILNPSRTETQIRTYNDDELKLLINIALLSNHGFKISKLASFSNLQIEKEVKNIVLNNTEDTAIDELILSLLEMDETRFSLVLNGLFAKYPVSEVYSKFIIPFLEKMGYLWQTGSIHPGQEHFISHLIRQKIIAEIDKLPPVTDNTKRVALYLPEHEWHELTLLIYKHHLCLNGIKTYYFGQALPFYALSKIIKDIKPTHLISSWITQVEPELLLHHCKELVKLTSAPIYISGFQANNLVYQFPENVRVINKLADIQID